jgi:nitroreductase
MQMSLDDAIERLGADKETYNRWVGVYIGILAVLLAICNVGGANATKEATHSNIAAANTWAFFQAKNIRRNAIGLAADDLELMLAAMPAMPDEARRQFEDKIKAYREQYRNLTTDPQKQEGLDELFVKGKLLEMERDVALRRDPYFDWSQALLQIAIVLASVYLIVGNVGLLGLSAGLGALGMLLMLNGFTLAIRLPFLG